MKLRSAEFSFIQRLNKHWTPDQILLAFLALQAILISTLARLPGVLIPIAALCGFLLIYTTVPAFLEFSKRIREELPPLYHWIWILALGAQIFWAFFRAPLDIDGIFYHLTIILEALQKNEWGDWSFLIWQVQNTPKFGELPNLGLIALGGPWGYRFAQFGHFATVILGTLAVYYGARELKLKQASLYALVFFLSPIVIKQMSANYVDVAVAATFLATLSGVIRVKKAKDWIWPALGAFLLVGTKMNGLLILACILPLLYFHRKQLPQLQKGIFLGVGFTLLGLASWMIPNWIEHGNPIFPLEPKGILPGSSLKLLPDEIPVHFLHGPVGELNLPLPLRWLLAFFYIEPVAQYDNAGGAWGFVAIWSFLCLGTALVLKKLKWKLNRVSIVYLCLVLSFIITPGRFIPRYAMLAGFILIFPAVKLLIETRLPSWVGKAFLGALLLQLPYVMAERAMLRGLGDVPASHRPGVIWENFVDIVQYGEPQSPTRWIHAPYAPGMRRDEPRKVEVGEDCVDLTALYWGRHFSNEVSVSPTCCRWPFDCGEQKLPD